MSAVRSPEFETTYERYLNEVRKIYAAFGVKTLLCDVDGTFLRTEQSYLMAAFQLGQFLKKSFIDFASWSDEEMFKFAYKAFNESYALKGPDPELRFAALTTILAEKIAEVLDAEEYMSLIRKIVVEGVAMVDDLIYKSVPAIDQGALTTFRILTDSGMRVRCVTHVSPESGWGQLKEAAYLLHLFSPDTVIVPTANGRMKGIDDWAYALDGGNPEEAMGVGDSVTADLIPFLQLGMWARWIANAHQVAAHTRLDAYRGHRKLRIIQNITQLVPPLPRAIRKAL